MTLYFCVALPRPLALRKRVRLFRRSPRDALRLLRGRLTARLAQVCSRSPVAHVIIAQHGVALSVTTDGYRVMPEAWVQRWTDRIALVVVVPAHAWIDLVGMEDRRRRAVWPVFLRWLTGLGNARYDCVGVAVQALRLACGLEVPRSIVTTRQLMEFLACLAPPGPTS